MKLHMKEVTNSSSTLRKREELLSLIRSATSLSAPLKALKNKQVSG